MISKKIIYHFKMGKKKPTSVPKETQKAPTKPQDTRINKQKEKGKLLAKIYRQYSRRKYSKYRLQYPKLRESEIINKIIKEWEALTQEDKLKLESQFLETGGADFLKDDSKSKSKSSSSKSKPKPEEGQAKQQEGKQGEQQGKPKKKKKPSPKVRIFVDKATDKNRDYRDDSDFKKDDGVKKKGKASPSGSSESVQLVVKGKKKIRKQKLSTKQQGTKKTGTTEYLSFFKYYYNRLASEHPRWKPAQINVIVKLLWRKRNARASTKKRPTISRDLIAKPVSGRVMYRRSKQASGMTLDQIKILWKKLPHESKKYWQIRGKGGRSSISKAPKQSIGKLKKILRLGSQSNPNDRNNFRWMNSLIKL